MVAEERGEERRVEKSDRLKTSGAAHLHLACTRRTTYCQILANDFAMEC